MSAKPINPERYDFALRVVEKDWRDGSGFITNEAIAELGKNIIFDPDILDTYNYEGWKPVHQDLLVVSAAVEYADRRAARQTDRWARNIKITVPVTALATWLRREVQESLQAALKHLTGDNWHFHFEQRKQSSMGARQRSLALGAERTFVIAYSDGLDSHCVAKMFGNGGTPVCVRMTKHRHLLKKGDMPFDQIPFRVNVPLSRESSVRSRGFKFAAVTAIVAQWTGLIRIVVPESGQGALGPVLSPLHNTYADYRNHPTYFRKMERFVKALLSHNVHYDQPRLWSTKGETITAFQRSTNGPLDELLETRSCWQQRWNARMDGRLRQCGLCAACLLRRMSMHAARVEEPRDTYVIADLSAPCFSDALPGRKKVRLSRTMVEHGSVGVRHLQRLADMADMPIEGLSAHAFEIARATGETQESVLKNIRHMLLMHAKEWRAFMAAQGEKSFLRRWAEGGCYDKSR